MWRTLRNHLTILTSLLVLTAVPAMAIHGLCANYYLYDGYYLEDFTFSDPDYSWGFSRLDPAIHFGSSQEAYDENNGNGPGFDWEPFGPGAGAFGVQWDGYITIPDGQAVYLGTESDDGSYVFLDGNLIVDNGGEHFPTYEWSSNMIDPGTYRFTTYLFCNALTPPLDKSGIDLWWSLEQDVVDDSGWVPDEWFDPVPEPTSLALLMMGLGAAALARRRRK